jgi:hypothetical protein
VDVARGICLMDGVVDIFGKGVVLRVEECFSTMSEL